tara:strand:- start:154 stop:474 length:321 start_codon:yes stop_codon:yes gene_type:complete
MGSRTDLQKNMNKLKVNYNRDTEELMYNYAMYHAKWTIGDTLKSAVGTTIVVDQLSWTTGQRSLDNYCNPEVVYYGYVVVAPYPFDAKVSRCHFYGESTLGLACIS